MPRSTGCGPPGRPPRRASGPSRSRSRSDGRGMLQAGIEGSSRGGQVTGNGGGGHGASMGSWIACLIMVIGFALGGVALIIWNWPLFWASVGVIVLGLVVAKAANIMEDVTEYGGGGAGGDPEPSS